MSDSADIVPLPARDDASIDTAPARPARSRREVITEAALAFPHLAILLYRLLRDRRVPIRRKWIAGLVAAYVVSPIDLVPDFLPIIGQVDDVLMVALALNHVIAGTAPEVVEEHWPGTEDAFDLVSGIVAWAAELVPSPVRGLLER